jgi:hypothetical protein
LEIEIRKKEEKEKKHEDKEKRNAKGNTGIYYQRSSSRKVDTRTPAKRGVSIKPSLSTSSKSTPLVRGLLVVCKKYHMQKNGGGMLLSGRPTGSSQCG